ncbi:hypothetical protein [Simkania sp.]|uniref:hypothetical protein n=1 Tax=Simkania sp. TaxID=34094 RepID=UPI003B51F05C
MTKGTCGVLSDLPTEMQLAIVELAKPHLTEVEYQTILKALPKLNDLSEKRWKKIQEYYEYAAKNAIKTPEQPITLNPNKLENLTKEQLELAKRLMPLVNEQLKAKKA